MGGLGWPALAVLVATGLYLLGWRGIGPVDLVTGAAYAAGGALAVKLPLVAVDDRLPGLWGHGAAPIAIYFNMLAALIILAASVVLVRGWGG